MNNRQQISFTKRTQMILQRIEDAILVGLLLLMIIMAVTQIFLRNLFGAGIVWSDVMVRILVLWVGLIGAMVASRKDNHIAIDLLDRYLPERAKVYTNFMVRLFTALICLLVAYYSLLFVHMEFAFGGMAFARVPSWLCEAIIPFAFSVIALRYFLLSFMNLKEILNSRS